MTITTTVNGSITKFDDNELELIENLDPKVQRLIYMGLISLKDALKDVENSTRRV